MSLNRTISSLATGFLVLLFAVPVSAQIRDMQLFAPPDQGTFGGGSRANQGFFFGFEFLQWAISTPEKTDIGFENDGELAYIGWDTNDPINFPDGRAIPIRNRNTLDTGWLRAEETGGERMELGWIQEHKGWKFGSVRLKEQDQYFYGNSVGVNFSDALYGGDDWTLLQGHIDPDGTQPVQRLAVIFDEMVVQNQVDFWSLQWEYVFRTHPTHRGSFWEFFAGVRYLELDELFQVDAIGGILDTSYWMMDAENHLIGPQLGVRMFHKEDRWTFSTEGRFFAGFNSQNFFQESTLGTALTPPGGVLEPLAMGPTSSQSSEHLTEISPAIELRVDLKYQVTRAINLRVGWTGLWMGEIARASNMFDYEIGNMGIDVEKNSQDVFLNGVNFGFDLNY